MTHLTALSLARLVARDPNIWGPDATAACGAVVTWVGESTTNLIWVAITGPDITPEMMPTCPRCAVLLDQALEARGANP